MIADALKLSVYFGESVTAGPDLASDALIGRHPDQGVTEPEGVGTGALDEAPLLD